LRKVKSVLTAGFVAVLLVVASAAPAFAFIHNTIPAGQCAVSVEQAGDNEAAEDALRDHNKVQDFPIGNSQGLAQSQAVEHCR
jgi:hypothetical protein